MQVESEDHESFAAIVTGANVTSQVAILSKSLSFRAAKSVHSIVYLSPQQVWKLNLLA